MIYTTFTKAIRNVINNVASNNFFSHYTSSIYVPVYRSQHMNRKVTKYDVIAFYSVKKSNKKSIFRINVLRSHRVTYANNVSGHECVVLVDLKRTFLATWEQEESHNFSHHLSHVDVTRPIIVTRLNIYYGDKSVVLAVYTKIPI